jgi:nitroreductase
MLFSELIQIRQSVRAYQNKSIEAEKLQLVLEALRLAPSASNAQPWKVIVIDEPELKNKIANATFSSSISFNRFSLTAPVIVVLTIEKTKTITQIGGWLKRRDFSLIDIGIAAEHFCLQAAELGLGTCILGWFREKTIRKLLNIPRSTRIGLLITLGYPADGYAIRPKIRKEYKEIIQFNKGFLRN